MFANKKLLERGKNMKYCPFCDMEFGNRLIVCPNCNNPLIDIKDKIFYGAG